MGAVEPKRAPIEEVEPLNVEVAPIEVELPSEEPDYMRKPTPQPAIATEKDELHKMLVNVTWQSLLVPSGLVLAIVVTIIVVAIFSD